MQTPATARHPQHTPAPLPAEVPELYRDIDGRYVTVWPRSPWDARLYQVLPHLSQAEQDVLATVDDFGDLVVTHRRDPASFNGMAFRPVQ